MTFCDVSTGRAVDAADSVALGSPIFSGDSVIPSSSSGWRIAFMMLLAAGGVVLGALTATLSPRLVSAVVTLLHGGP